MPDANTRVIYDPVSEIQPRDTVHGVIGNATAVIPGLFLGTREDAEAFGDRVPDGWACISVTEYRKRYNRAEELPREPSGSLDMPFMMDTPNGWCVDRHKLDLIAETIWHRRLEGKSVLVHCIQAQERSPIAVAWFLAWSGHSASLTQAYDLVARLHPRTERRDKWIQGATPGSEPQELRDLLEASRHLANCDAHQRQPAIESLVSAAARWGSK